MVYYKGRRFGLSIFYSLKYDFEATFGFVTANVGTVQDFLNTRAKKKARNWLNVVWTFAVIPKLIPIER